jgi:TldD protein
LTLDSLQSVLGELAGPGIDAADLYFQGQISESWALEDGIVKEGSFNLDQGVGVRAQSGEKPVSPTAMPSTLKPWLGSPCRPFDLPRRAERHGAGVPHQDDRAVCRTIRWKCSAVPRRSSCSSASMPPPAPRSAHPAGQREHGRVWERILVAATDGGLADVRPLVRFNVSVIVEQNGRRERGGHGGGGRTDYRYFAEDRAMGYAREALRQALVNLEAIPAPAGTLPVVLGSGWSGVLLHEAVGHGLEGDFNRKGSSAYSGRMGEKVASSCAPSSMTAPWPAAAR